MALAAEWSCYAILRRGLRVLWNPKAAQRRSYSLSLPYCYAILLMTLSTILHWLISQSIFLGAVASACHLNYDLNLEYEVRQVDSHPPEEDMMYSPVKWGAIAVDGEVGHSRVRIDE
ncbi:hypothetical protein AN3323.2 [Aspergillus nidulans FGSC A4]|uniref:Uncharacterized protein n=1 Tax=Emericella nidulans (strain FGSC A4 / ATCC 38163 / CBS 112.46 / NRRL 194 / M139) TaxID=227321 RepID=Q5B807_EMENI|nr:hypothetical protein [Aspergillus nidulans FGSC A4]EAA63291.1 hypothetical protein AN3323.2 [Aspergillus nidulans FGSC A4]CBF82947.1 TPA: conserved hypothetical protein [Aspergillus nidulans FGSC A4]|eukprot:XP_660927.1 hypothetical protein AN3323.2 [Aspergillus nidulans FGSC A4]